ncbi:MAG: peptide chain release factor 1 [Acidimicrobiia bacterium]|nr:peptide chain release factor 1 [Acidimicrobiia bacterium]
MARVNALRTEFSDVEAQLGDPHVGDDPKKLATLGRRHSELGPIIDLADRLQEVATDIDEATELAEADPGMADELRQLASDRRAEAEELASKLRSEMTPTNPDDDRDVIVEVRAAAGGAEAAIWAGDLLRMLERYGERQGFRVEGMDSSPSETGGYTKATIAIKGDGAYGRLRFEAGVHRVQRVPKTESQGRIHTSTATVAVLPEVEEVEVEIDPNEVKVDVYRSTGPGGQSVNTTDSAVRLTHLPTGLVVTCQDEKSQLQNKQKAFRILRARLHQMAMDEAQSEVAGERRSQVGTGGRSEKIRTYNFKENRVTDHRIGMTIRRLDEILDGDLDDFVEELRLRDREDRMAEEFGA